MRLSIEHGDPGYPSAENYALIYNSTVYLDGVRQKYALTADEEQGLVKRLRVDDQGHHVIDPAQPDQWASETVYGKVEIKKVD